jgi:hypothetical protein
MMDPNVVEGHGYPPDHSLQSADDAMDPNVMEGHGYPYDCSLQSADDIEG